MCLCCLLVLDHALHYRSIYLRGIPLGGLPMIFCRQRVEDEDDLEDMIRALGPEILLNNPKGLENLKRVTKASKETVYGVEKGCPTH